MSAVEQPAVPVRPAHGARCPRCNVGLLYTIAISDTGELLHCFNCDTSGSVAREGEYAALTPPGETPTGFQLTAEQLAAKAEAGVDTGALGAPHATPAAPAAEQPAAEPPATHDQAPPAGGEAPVDEGGTV